jgi:predicted nicotinamide N-methyase
LSSRAEGVAHLGTPFNVLELQEINQGVFGSAGTGSTTWESSIVMSMFFSAVPEMLRGDVVELGSGVGVGSMMLSQLPIESDGSSESKLRSITLTDGNHEVLEQCKDNVRRATSSYPLFRRVPMQVAHVDWYDYVDEHNGHETPTTTEHQRYDTVLASDCAYLYPDILALSRAMVSLCKRDGIIHVFGPCNRGALHELVLQLRDVLHMDVVLDFIEMSRYRLKPPKYNYATFPDASHLRHFCRSQDECIFASKNAAKFMHVRATRPPRASQDQAITDID